MGDFPVRKIRSVEKFFPRCGKSDVNNTKATEKVKASKQIIQSANFKRDYIASLAVCMFTAIVLGEIIIAVSVPMFLGRTDAMAKEVRRIRLRETFDLVRWQSYKTNCANTNAKLERDLVVWELNKLANYLRVNSEYLNSEETARLQKIVDESSAVLKYIQDNKSFSKASTLDTGSYVNSILNKKDKK